jgi:tetratricopeptide (TPR) repeat protein
MNSAELDALWDWSDLVKTEQLFRDVGSPEAMTQAARAMGLQRRIGDAHKLLDSIDRSEPLVEARAVLERGRLHNDAGEIEQALACFEDALAKFQALGAEFYAVDAMHMIAIIKNDVAAHRQAIAMAEAASDDRAKSWDASLLNNLGWTLFEKGDAEEALHCFEEAVRKREERGASDRTHVARWCVARALRELKRHEEALDILYPLLETENTDGYVHDEIAENLLATGKLEAARPYFEEAARLLPPGDDASNRRAELGRAGRFATITPNRISISRAFLIESDFLWIYIVGREFLPKWLGTVVPTGGKEVPHNGLSRGMIFDLHIDNDASDVVHCEVLECVYPRKIVLKWNDSTVTITVTESALTLTHEGIEDLATYGAAWHSAIDLLSHVMAGGSRETFSENCEALLPEYRRLISRTLNRETR